MVDADQPIRMRVPVCRTPGEGLTANGAAHYIRHPAHEPENPERKISHWHPDILRVRLLEHGQQKTEDGIVRITVGQEEENDKCLAALAAALA